MSEHNSVEKQTRTQRRVLRTKATIEDAFVKLVIEKGYDKVSVEDITNRADVARATFYAHYTNKEALLSAVFSRLIDSLEERISHREQSRSGVRTDVIEAAYRHAGEMRDLYKACLSDSWARQAYLSTMTRYAEQSYRDTMEGVHRQPRLPISVMASGFAGAHVSILESWLDGKIGCSVEELAAMEVDLLVGGSARALGIDPGDLGYGSGTTFTNSDRQEEGAIQEEQSPYP
jgi:AcrR family transcriptional regulator